MLSVYIHYFFHLFLLFQPPKVNTLHLRMFCAKFFLKIGPVVLEKKTKMGKVYEDDDKMTKNDNIQIFIRETHKT